MTESQLNGGRKATDAKETGWQVLIAFAIWVAAQHFIEGLPKEALWGVFMALVGKQGVHAWGNVKEHMAEALNKPKG
jgi:hypothetical protein